MTSNLNMIDIPDEHNDNINTKLDIKEKEYLIKFLLKKYNYESVLGALALRKTWC